jgi:hypothetical protein
LKIDMPIDTQIDNARQRRMILAERKLKEARLRLARTERSILYWSRVLADLKYEQSCAIQSPLWPSEEGTLSE